MSDLTLFFKLGFQHITDLNGYDHILYLFITCGIFTFRDLKKVVWMVTGFTVGHSLSLAFSVIKSPPIPSVWIEWLIAFTIFISAVYQLLSARKSETTRFPKWMYGITTVFGLIHGMGFSSMLKSLLGAEESIAIPLLGFNFGLEIGQLFIVLFAITLSSLCINRWSIKKSIYVYILSISILLISGWMMITRML